MSRGFSFSFYRLLPAAGIDAGRLLHAVDVQLHLALGVEAGEVRTFQSALARREEILAVDRADPIASIVLPGLGIRQPFPKHEHISPDTGTYAMSLSRAFCTTGQIRRTVEISQHLQANFRRHAGKNSSYAECAFVARRACFDFGYKKIKIYSF
ncbi:hypothetical protein D3C78_1200080 [compost metagenome]